MKIMTILRCYIVFLLACGLLMSCADYEEDSFDNGSKSRRAFALMNTKEKILHDKIMEKWDQSYLVELRDAVRKREIVPAEDEMPFGDMPGVIVMVNDVKLAVSDSTSNSRKAARFETLDEKWYRVMKVMADKGQKKELKGSPAPPTVEEQAEIDAQREAERKAAEAVGEAIRTGKVKITASTDATPGIILPDKPVEWDPEDVVGADEMSALKFPLMRCEQAQAYFDDIIKQGRPVVRMDIEVLEEMFSACAASRVQKFYK